ncbi:MAG TPA: electron transfer flavoprotein subunit alpha/FixB family protein [Terriglobales bacterium]|nr:electron transfer flavoprotein subunit alpha/FixB family protein [Terriglobales bacterium]
MASEHATVLVVAEHRGGKLSAATAEAIAAAQQLAAPWQAAVHAVLLEGAAESGLAAQLARYQLAGVLAARHPALAEYTPEAYTQALQEIVSRRQPRAVLFAHSYQTRDFAPRLATRMARALFGDLTALRVEDGRLTVSRPMFQGRLAADLVVPGEAPAFLSVQIGAFRADRAALAAAPAPIAAEMVAPAAPAAAPEAPFQEAKQAVDLTQAAIIVSAGRGIKEAKNLDLIRALADALGGEVAASRPICDSGWLPMDRQVGSSGQTVAPKLYLAVGISGAIQHLVGMKSSRAIVAINKDREAPIFEIADYGVVGDLFEVVPALIEAVKAAKAGG